MKIFIFQKFLALNLISFVFISPISLIFAQSGVLIPTTIKDKPDAGILSLDVMNIDICIDNQTAGVKITQIFENHTEKTLEGKFLFALSENASVSDFAVWDNDLRIPGVMMEKRRANEIYSQIKQTRTDPGILQQDDEHGGNSSFSAKVFPIFPFGTKRIEMEYTEVLPIEGLSSHFSFPLKPSFGEAQKVNKFNLKLCVYNDYPISDLIISHNFPLNITKQTADEFSAEFHAENIALSEDFSLSYKINVPQSTLSFITYRAPVQISAFDLRDPSLGSINTDGFFQMQAILNENPVHINQSRRLLLIQDTSLSMYGEKLEKAYEATSYFLHSLNSNDEFNLILFGNDPVNLSEKPLAATPENVENALQFIKNSTLGGGTNLLKVFEKSKELSKIFSPGERSLVFISDVNPTLETTDIKKISQVFDKENKQNYLKFYAIALGNDANTDLLKELTEKTRGYFDKTRETEDISLKLKIFFDKIGNPGIENLQFKTPDAANFYDVFSTGLSSFNGSRFTFVGRYKEAKDSETVGFSGQFGAQNINLTKSVSLPEFADLHSHLPRLWARAKIDYLVRQINNSGESEDLIAEIIRLSEKYKLVSPYTAFIAAPRTLLRPRLIQPGDPVIRVKTDDSIKEVFAVLPFGETLPLKFLENEGVWQTRFFAPAWMSDGTYNCRLILTDKDGNGFEERKSFVVDSRAPKVKISLSDHKIKAGESLKIKVSADSDTLRLTAKFYGTKPVQLFWSNEEKASVGDLLIPENLAAGKYVLKVVAEDFAHNQSSEEVDIEVLPH